jgi:hypothetical protein
MQWFGYRPFALVCHDGKRVETPIGAICFWCEEGICPDEDGFLVDVFTTTGHRVLPIHAECNFHRTVGGIYHQQRRCSCFGGKLAGDPDDLSVREAAALAMEYYTNNRGF